MKKFLTLIVVAAAALIASPQAEARPHHSHQSGYTYVSGRSSCGCVVYSQRYISRYDRCGRPFYSVRVLPVTHRCRHSAHRRPQYGHQYGYNNGYRASGRGHVASQRGSYTNHGNPYYSSGGRCR